MPSGYVQIIAGRELKKLRGTLKKSNVVFARGGCMQRRNDRMTGWGMD
jgi:hypothetical protein